MLKPQRKMPRNARCWCGSGKKWKKCHFARKSRTPISPGEGTSRLHRELKKGYCSHPEANSVNCSDRIVRAHTVQRRGGIAAIAENGHVVSVKSAAQNVVRNRGDLVPCEVGTRSASTFMGFCSKHDNSMFRTVESPIVSLTPESCFLLGFRAVSYELYSKRAELRWMSIMREFDFGKSFAYQAELQQRINLHEYGVKRALNDCMRWKNKYDEIFFTSRFQEYRFVGAKYSSVLPVVGCGAFHPEFDFTGKPLQQIGRGTAPHEHVCLNLTVLNGTSVLVIGWIEGQEGPAESFGRSFADLPNEQKANMGIQLAVEHIENAFLRPSWWGGLSDTVRDALVTRMRSGTGAKELDRQSNCLLPDGHAYTIGIRVVDSIGPM